MKNATQEDQSPGFRGYVQNMYGRENGVVRRTLEAARADADALGALGPTYGVEQRLVDGGEWVFMEDTTRVSQAVLEQRVSERLPRPFSGIYYSRNEANCCTDEEPCAICGNPVRKTSSGAMAVHVASGGGAWVGPNDAEPDHAGDMGLHPLGSRCLKRYPELKTVTLGPWSAVGK